MDKVLTSRVSERVAWKRMVEIGPRANAVSEQVSSDPELVFNFWHVVNTGT